MPLTSVRGNNNNRALFHRFKSLHKKRRAPGKEASMNSCLDVRWFARAVSVALLCSASMLLVACNDDDEVASDNSSGLVVAKAACGPNDNPEKDLQGQVSAAQRAAGFKGYNCNLQLVGQTRGDGASWQNAW